MSKTAHTFDPLQQLASATAMDDELSEKLLQALISTQAFPINLAWIVPLLQYKHISSLTTHLKRHFKKDLDYQKLTSGSRTHTYFISVECFRGICNYARHSERRTLAQYWLKIMGDPIPIDPSSNTTTTPATVPVPTTISTTTAKRDVLLLAAKAQQLHQQMNNSDTDSCPSSPEAVDRLHASSSSLELEPSPSLSSSSLSDKEKGEALSATALYHYNLSSASSPSSASSALKPPVKKDFTRVNILSKKRKMDPSTSGSTTGSPMMTSNSPGPSPTNESEQDKEHRENFGIKPNLKLLSELALGLR